MDEAWSVAWLLCIGCCDRSVLGYCIFPGTRDTGFAADICYAGQYTDFRRWAWGRRWGAVSITGVPESQINLEIVQKMDGILGFYGVSPILLRTEDRSLHDSSASTLREKKVSDLKNRVEAIEAVPNGILVSIHQNTYTDSRYHGTQAFYAPTDGSSELAGYIQSLIQMKLQPDNNRNCKQIPDTVYLMNHISCPAVLVECGFLTNPEEEALLREQQYQKKLAAVLSAAWLTAGQA